MVILTTEKIGFNERLVSASFMANANFAKFYPHWENRLKRIFLHFFATTRIHGKYSRARRILYWMCEEVNLVFWSPCKLMMSQNFDWIKHNQSEANIAFAIPVKSSFQAVNLRSFHYCPCKVVKCGFFVTFASRHKYVVNKIFHHLCFKCNYGFWTEGGW